VSGCYAVEGGWRGRSRGAAPSPAWCLPVSTNTVLERGPPMALSGPPPAATHTLRAHGATLAAVPPEAVHWDCAVGLRRWASPARGSPGLTPRPTRDF
jgi:hypothetical protein